MVLLSIKSWTRAKAHYYAKNLQAKMDPITTKERKAQEFVSRDFVKTLVSKKKKKRASITECRMRIGWQGWSTRCS
jgi:hypothetical protein